MEKSGRGRSREALDRCSDCEYFSACNNPSIELGLSIDQPVRDWDTELFGMRFRAALGSERTTRQWPEIPLPGRGFRLIAAS